MAARTMGRLARTGLAVSALLGAGCAFIGKTFDEQRTARVSADAGVLGLDVSTRNGSVAVARGEGGDIVITATLRARSEARLALMKVVAETNDEGVLVIAPTPPDGGWWSNEGCSIEVSAPASATAAGVKVRTSNGRIAVIGVEGRADLRSSNGRISVDGAAGEVRAASSNGRIEISGAAGPIDAETSNGAVTVRLTPGAHGPVRIDTSNGAVTLEVGPAFEGRLSLKTSNGSISVPDGVRTASRRRRSADLVMGSGDARSVVTTSNGSIRVRMLGID